MRRTFDIAGSVVGLIFGAPLFLLTFMLVVLTSRGPILYCQLRTGLHGNPFVIYKFRTMRWEPDAQFKRCIGWRDKRVTLTGHFLRWVKWDELPQFINVLKGDMTLFAHRPYEISMDKELAVSIPGYTVLYLFKPGIVSWSKFFSRGKIEREVALDIKRYSKKAKIPLVSTSTQ